MIKESEKSSLKHLQSSDLVKGYSFVPLLLRTTSTFTQGISHKPTCSQLQIYSEKFTSEHQLKWVYPMAQSCALIVLSMEFLKPETTGSSPTKRITPRN